MSVKCMSPNGTLIRFEAKNFLNEIKKDEEAFY